MLSGTLIVPAFWGQDSFQTNSQTNLLQVRFDSTLNQMHNISLDSAQCSINHNPHWLNSLVSQWEEGWLRRRWRSGALRNWLSPAWQRGREECFMFFISPPCLRPQEPWAIYIFRSWVPCSEACQWSLNHYMTVYLHDRNFVKVERGWSWKTRKCWISKKKKKDLHYQLPRGHECDFFHPRCNISSDVYPEIFLPAIVLLPENGPLISFCVIPGLSELQDLENFLYLCLYLQISHCSALRNHHWSRSFSIAH